MVKDHLLDKYSENELLSQNFRVYTTLDPALQRAAAAAVDAGVKNVDLLLAKKYEKWRKEAEKKGSTEAIPQVQIALVAMDPEDGRDQSLNRRPGLRAEPAKSRAGASPARVGIQTIRICSRVR